MSESGRRFVVHGRVQGVGFRFFTERRARALCLRGRVRNQLDGTVEVRVRGDEPSVEALRAALARGPSHSWVSRIEEGDLPSEEDWTDFQIEI